MSKFEPKVLLNKDNDSIIEELKRVYFKFFNGKYMTQKEFNLHSRITSFTVCRRFKTWENALKIAGINFDNTSRPPRIPTLEILADLNKVKDLNNGQYFTYQHYKQNHGKHDKRIIGRFGYKTWEELINKELGLFKVQKIRRVINLNREKKVTSEDKLFDELKRVWDILGRRPSYSEFRKIAAIGTKVYEKKYGSWTKAIEQFCLKNSSYNGGQHGLPLNTNKELLILELQKLKDANGLKKLTYPEYRKLGGKISSATFNKYFETWPNALKAVGLEPVFNRIPENLLLFDELQRVWEILGRQPKSPEFDKLSKYPSSYYTSRFKGWHKAIYAFIEDRESSSSNSDHIELSKLPNLTNEAVSENQIDAVKNVAEQSASGLVYMKTARIASSRLRFIVLHRDNFSCVLCGRSPAKDDKIILHVDHIKPYSKGGETLIENLQTLCSKCNLGKSNLDI